MPKSRFKLKRESIGDDLSSDFTLSAYANSSFSSGCGRLRKNALHHVTDEIKLLNVTDDDRGWEEKLEDFADIDDGEDERKKHRRKKKAVSEDSNSNDGCDYPLDVWYLIAEYLVPEDIGLFASICRSSHAVVNSARFWFYLYKRLYRPVDEMPEILQPACMVRRYGLRALVIRSLYYIYQPFVASYQTRLETDAHQLVGRLCVVAWTQRVQGKSQWLYSFKLKQRTSPHHSRNQVKRKPDLLAMLDDINANPDEGCKLLQVRANNYSPLPMITGQALIDSQQKVQRDFGSYNLLLQFSSGPSRYEPCLVGFQGVVSTRILDWWHPAFSHNDQLHSGLISSLLPTDCDFSE